MATLVPPFVGSVSCSRIVADMDALRQEFPRAPHGHGRRLHERVSLSSGLTPARLSAVGPGGYGWKVPGSLLGVVLIAGSPGGKWNGCQGWRQPSRSDAVGALYSRGTSATLIQLGRRLHTTAHGSDYSLEFLTGRRIEKVPIERESPPPLTTTRGTQDNAVIRVSFAAQPD